MREEKERVVCVVLILDFLKTFDVSFCLPLLPLLNNANNECKQSNEKTGFREDFAARHREWRAIYDSTEPHTMPLPGDWEGRVTPLERLCCVRCIRPDKVVLAVQNFVVGDLGQKFVEPPVFDIGLSFKESSCAVPLVFVLSKGSDPSGALLKLADDVS